MASSSELKLLRQLSDLLEGQATTPAAFDDEKIVKKIGALALSPSSGSRFLNEDAAVFLPSNSTPGHPVSAGVVAKNGGSVFFTGNECNEEVIDFNDVMNGSGGAAAVSSYLEKMLSHEEEDEEVDEDNAASTANRISKESSSNFLLEEADNLNDNEVESEDVTVEIKLLEKFK